ncbi:MAG: shikimate dehydrogenase [Candidatus Altiarchaeota archaeon]|nr:shikimate dehydrogenase [Candidatus Altiarchaeota archaeon]
MGKLFGVIGHPIRHSLSPLMHTAAFKKLGLDCEYAAFDVTEDDLKGELENFRKDFTGLNVTIPHKVSVIKYLDGLSEEASLIGAVNTVKFGEQALGYNTDGLGCLRSLAEAGVALKGKRVLILGAGGAARAIAFQLVKEKVAVTLTDKEMEKADNLAGDIRKKTRRKVKTTELDEESLRTAIDDADVLINATPAGMWPKVDETPINPKLLRDNIAVMDIVYNPVETKFIRLAKKQGCKTIDGVGMFVQQGAESLRIWLNVKPPVDVMRKAVVKELKKG